MSPPAKGKTPAKGKGKDASKAKAPKSKAAAKPKAAADGKAPAKSRGSAAPSRASIDGRGPEILIGDGQSAAAMSPFPPIADYAFLSNCHTGALVAPDGAIDWLCVPRFDSPSVFGTLLDRQGGSFRFGPFGINAPSARIYEPGTNVLATTWKTPTGWVLVRDALTMGPRQGVDRTTPHTRPPADDDADHMLVRVVVCLEDEVEMELSCEPVFDYCQPARRVDARRRAGPRERDRRGPDDVARHQPGPRPRGERARARHVLRKGEQAFCALSWSDQVPLPAERRRGQRADRGDRLLLAALDQERADPRPPLAGTRAALGAGDQGAHLHAHRGDGGGADDLAAGDPRRGAQLGLPLHVATRQHLHAAGAALPEPRLGGRGVHAVRRRPRAQRRRRAADHVRDRRPPRPDASRSARS